MKNVVLINSFPNSEKKILTLKKQISKLKEIGCPIILCSGCEVNSDIINSVDYFFLNKEKIVKSALYHKKCQLEGKDHVSLTALPPNNGILIFVGNVDPTISRNTKLLFGLAEKLGFETALYTEDDVIVPNINYYVENLNILNNSKIKFCAVGSQKDNTFRYTNHYFANIKFFNQTFSYPSNEKDLYDPQICKTIFPWMPYEYCFGFYLKQFEEFVHLIPVDYFENVVDQNCLNFRYDDINFIANQYALILKRKNGIVQPFFYNFSKSLVLNVKIYLNSKLDNSFLTQKDVWLTGSSLTINDIVKFEITDQNGGMVCKEVKYCSDDDILAIEN